MVHSFVDDYTRLTWLYLLKKILKLARLFIAFTKCFSMNLVSQSNIFVPMQKITSILVSIRILKKKGLFMSSSMMTLHDKMGWWQKDRHLLNVTRSLLYQMNVLKHFQREAVLTAANLINRLPSKSIDNKSPLDTIIVHHPHCVPRNSPVPNVFGYTAVVTSINIIGANLILLSLGAFSWDTLMFKKGINASTLLNGNSMFQWMSHFVNLYHTILYYSQSGGEST